MENVRNITETSIGVVERLCNSNNIDEKLETLKRKLEQLSSRHMDINTEVEHAENQGKKQRREVENWSINVKRIENEVQSIEQAVQESGGVFLRAKFGNRVEKMIEEVAELIDQGRFPQGLTLDVMETREYPLLTTNLAGKEFEINLDKIWENLMKVDVARIGIHGMGGVGKTALVTHIQNRLLEKRDSFKVCWVTVSQDFSLEKLQTKISKTINLDLSNEDDVRKRAAKLAQALRRMKLVLILDDVWKYFSLQEVGIPVEVNGCKLILTTRFLNVCREMDCSKYVEVLPLNEEDAWNLFMEKLGDDMALSPEVRYIARSIAKECAGLPLGIITIARSMRGVGIDIHGWRNALEELKNSRGGLDDMKDEVLQVLKFSYSSLKDPKLQECFLYCSLYHEDDFISRNDLIGRLIDDEIIEQKRNMQAKFDKGHAMLNKLQDAYLLEEVVVWVNDKRVKMHGVKMHDLLRDMAIQITQDRFMAKAFKGLKDLPDEDEWKDDLEKVSLMKNRISKIPSNVSPRCPKLSTLLLKYNYYLKSIPHSFFAHMPGLKVLDLSFTDIRYLSDSIFNLENLTTLLLRGCKCIEHVPSLAKLTSLRRLDLSGTRIKEIPQGLEMLVNLRYLDLYSKSLRIFPTGILPKFSHLEYLKFYSNSKKLTVKGEEIASLKKLEIFRGQFYNIQDFNTYVRFLEEEEGGPSKYLLQVGVAIYEYDFGCTFEEDKAVVLGKYNIRRSRGGEDSLVLPKDVQYLELNDNSDLRSLCDAASFNKAAELKRVWNLRVLIRGERAGSSPIPPGTFSRLKYFKIFNCNNIKKLFTPELLLHLHNLEVIDVNCCSQLVEIIGASSNEVEEEEDEEVMHPTIFSLSKLRSLQLECLPKLKSICASNQLMACDSIQEIHISECPKLKRLRLSLPLLNGQVCPPPSLKEIVTEKEWWESLEWDRPNSKTVLESVFVDCRSSVLSWRKKLAIAVKQPVINRPPMKKLAMKQPVMMLL